VSRDAAAAARGFAPAERFLGLALAVMVFHHLGSVVPAAAEQWVDLLTPFAVLGAAAWTLASLQPGPGLLVVAAAAAIAYVDGHGIHLGANAVSNAGPTGAAADEAHFWDEIWGHIEWHAGFFVLLGALCAADRRARAGAVPLALAAALLGFTLFTNTVEGGDWWLALLASAAFVPWAAVRPTPIRVAVAAAFGLCAAGIGVWAAWHGGVPQFTEL
jgi:hypothetical protein